MTIIPGIGYIDRDCGLVALEACSDGFYKTGSSGVKQILAT